ncbi:unnamed protein product [Rangifer tarandus platyrhynchus]|uniref:Uncharacterized protein n=1 Tax=Rangifer tarandus platyrhynchus TaxID=3082113 RepID=A0ABN8ZMK5_RANTA|nr:unnamed protein product [Rangifer tarandus platyrhynchus]
MPRPDGCGPGSHEPPTQEDPVPPPPRLGEDSAPAGAPSPSVSPEPPPAKAPWGSPTSSPPPNRLMCQAHGYRCHRGFSRHRPQPIRGREDGNHQALGSEAKSGAAATSAGTGLSSPEPCPHHHAQDSLHRAGRNPTLALPPAPAPGPLPQGGLLCSGSTAPWAHSPQVWTASPCSPSRVPEPGVTRGAGAGGWPSAGAPTALGAPASSLAPMSGVTRASETHRLARCVAPGVWRPLHVRCALGGPRGRPSHR